MLNILPCFCKTFGRFLSLDSSIIKNNCCGHSLNVMILLHVYCMLCIPNSVWLCISIITQCGRLLRASHSINQPEAPRRNSCLHKWLIEKSLPKSLAYFHFYLWISPKFGGVLYIHSFIFWSRSCLENLLCAIHCVPGIRDRDIKLCVLIYYKCQCELLVVLVFFHSLLQCSWEWKLL